MVHRTRDLLATICKPEQTAFIRGRDISMNALLLHDVTAYVTETDRDVSVVSTDYFKCFDRVPRSTLYKVHDKIYGKGFGDWLRTMYTDTMRIISVNGVLSRAIPVGGGSPQGCPYSPSGWAVLAESLADMLRADPRVKGVMLPGGIELNLIHFADDMQVFCEGDDSALAALDVIER